MSTFIRILEGTYRARSLAGKIFPLVSDYKQTVAGGSFVTVFAGDVISGTNNVRVNVTDRKSFVVVLEEAYIEQQAENVAEVQIIEKEQSDQDIDERIKERFEVLDLMTCSIIAGDVRGLIVTGPPGVGKSYGVEAQLDKAGLFNKVAGKRSRYHVVKGASTALGLYANLFKYSDKGDVTVFDDCDGVLQDEVSLNLLKGALDSGKKRRLAWNSSSSTFLEKEGIPENFLFHGSIIFITNVKFDNVRSAKLKDHLEALMSRCHYLDLTMDSMREKLIRIKQVARIGELFKDYAFNAQDEHDVIEFMNENTNQFREVSIRTCLKIADLKKISPVNWKALTRQTCMHRE